MNFEDKVLALFDKGRRSAAYVAGYLIARAQAAAIAAEADRLIAEMAVENAELREALAAIKARVNGEYDHPALVKQGALGRFSDDVVRIIDSALASPAVKPSCVEWQSEDVEPIEEGWYAVQLDDGSLCIRAWGDGFWWSPLKDGWLSGLPAGFRWFGPLETLDWETPLLEEELKTQHAPDEPEQKAAVEALDIAELRDLILILRRKIGGALWSLDEEEEELAVRAEKAIEALDAHRGEAGHE